MQSDESVHLARHQKKDGTPIDVDVRGRPLLVPGKSLRLVVATDVTERLAAARVAQEAEERVTSTNEMLQSLIDTAPQAMVVVDERWRISRWSRGAELLFGWSAAEVVGRPAPFVPEEEQEEVRARQARADRGYFGKPREVVRLPRTVAGFPCSSRRRRSSAATAGRRRISPCTPISRSENCSRSSCGRRRRWKPSEGWPAGSRTTSTTSSPSSRRTRTCCSTGGTTRQIALISRRFRPRRGARQR